MKGSRVSYVIPYNENGGHKFGINKLLLSDDGETLYSAGRDGSIRVWNIANSSESSSPTCTSIMDNHTDWVNDVIFTNENKTLISCSNDNTIRFWDTETKSQKEIIRAHNDYVAQLTYPSEKPYFISCGLDSTIKFWDVNSGFLTQQYQQKNSIYTISANKQGTLLASGSTDKIIRIYDPREKKKLFKLRGHQDNIRCVMLNQDGSLAVSASTDSSVKIWDLRQQRCLKTYYVHQDSVWTLCLDEVTRPNSQNVRILSGGRDNKVFFIDPKQNETCQLLEEDSPILSVAMEKDRKNIWVSTTKSSIKRWQYSKIVQFAPKEHILSPRSGSFTHFPGSSPVHSKVLSSPILQHVQSPDKKNPLIQQLPSSPPTNKAAFVENTPEVTIPGSAGIIKHHIMSNRKQVLAQDTEGVVTLWDVTTGKLVNTFGEVSLDEKAKQLNEMVSISQWFSVECKLGCLEINLDFPNCFNAEVYAIEAGFDAGEEDKVNYGEMVIRSLFRQYLQQRRAVLKSIREQALKRSAEKAKELSEKEEKETQKQPPANPAGHEQEDVQGDNKNETENPPSDEQKQPAPEGEQNNTAEPEKQQASQPEEEDSTPGTPQEVPSDNEDAADSQPDGFKFELPESTAIIVHNEKLDASACPFKRRVNEFNGSENEATNIPKWVEQALVQPVVPSINLKLTFILEAYNPKDLPNLPGTTLPKLTAHRILRIKKVAQYVAQKLDLKLPTRKEFDAMKEKYLAAKSKIQKSTSSTAISQQQGPTPTPAAAATATSAPQAQPAVIDPNAIVPAEEFIEVLCNEKVLSPSDNLGAVNAFYKGNQIDIRLHFRRKYHIC